MFATIGITALIGAFWGDHAYTGGVVRMDNVRGNPKLVRVILYIGGPEDRQIDPAKLRVVHTQLREWDVLNRRLFQDELMEVQRLRDIVLIRYTRKGGLDMVTTIKYIYKMQPGIRLPPNWMPEGA